MRREAIKLREDAELSRRRAIDAEDAVRKYENQLARQFIKFMSVYVIAFWDTLSLPIESQDSIPFKKSAGANLTDSLRQAAGANLTDSLS